MSTAQITDDGRVNDDEPHSFRCTAPLLLAGASLAPCTKMICSAARGQSLLPQFQSFSASPCPSACFNPSQLCRRGSSSFRVESVFASQPYLQYSKYLWSPKGTRSQSQATAPGLLPGCQNSAALNFAVYCFCWERVFDGDCIWMFDDCQDMYQARAAALSFRPMSTPTPNSMSSRGRCVASQTPGLHGGGTISDPVHTALSTV